MTVNGVDISNDEFFYWLSYYCYNAAYYGSFYGYDMDFSDAEIRQDMIDSTTDAVAYHAVLRQMCEKENVVPSLPRCSSRLTKTAWTICSKATA